jgi:hypothetical protein
MLGFFCIGDDGTMWAAQGITGEINRRHLNIGVIGITMHRSRNRNLCDGESMRLKDTVRTEPRKSLRFRGICMSNYGTPAVIWHDKIMRFKR